MSYWIKTLRGISMLCIRTLRGRERDLKKVMKIHTLKHWSKIKLESHLFILSFMSLALGDIPVKILLCRIPGIFLHMFSSRTFMVSWLIFKSFIYLEFIFMYSVSWQSSFIFFFAHSCQYVPPSFVEEDIFTPFYASVPFVEY